MTAYTRLGSGLWEWEPWLALPIHARMLWLALYTSGEAKRNVPGLWQGGFPAMADASHLPADEVVGALDLMIDRGMVEYDPRPRVLRLCELPDPGEYPSSGKVIRSWWTRFKTLPQCGVRDAHVNTLAWILDTGSRLTGKAVSADHQTAWSQTFGTVVVPPPRRRGVRRLSDYSYDTSTQVQPSLFSPAAPVQGEIAPQREASYPQNPQIPVDNFTPPVDNSAVLRQMNKINIRDTISDTISDTNRIPDPGSRIPEDLSSLLPEGAGYGARPAPVLTLVPTYTVADVIQALSQGPWDSKFSDTHQEAISSLLPTWAAAGVTLGDLRVLAQANAVFGHVWNARVLTQVDLPAKVLHAKNQLAERAERLSMLAEWKKTQDGH